MTPGTTETYTLIERIKKAHIIDRKYEDKEKEQPTPKHSVGSPESLYDIHSDQAPARERNVHDILLTMMNNRASHDYGSDGSIAFDQSSSD